VKTGRIANIGPHGRRQRRIRGLWLLAVGLLAVGGFILVGRAPAWTLLAFIPFWLGALGLLQSLERT
jgi:hypothetical protein